jgi:hypothetical protein
MLNLPIINPLPNERFEANLRKMHLEGLLAKPWNVRIKLVVQDFYQPELSEEPERIQGNLKFYTPEFVGKLYNLELVGEENWWKEEATWGVYFVVKKLDPKMSWKVEHCKLPELRELFAFLLHICYPTKPHQITKGFATTVIYAYKFDRQVNWAAIFVKNLEKLASALSPEKHTYLCPFVVHGYNQEQVLTPVEESEYDKAEAAWKFQLDVKLEEVVDTEESDASGSVSLTPTPPAKPVGPSGFKAWQPKKAFRSKPTSGNTGKQPGSQVGDQVFQDGLQMVQMGLKEMKEEYQYASQSVSQLCSTLGCK